MMLAMNLQAQHFVTDRVLSREKMIRDIDLTVRVLEKHHPALYIYLSRDDFHSQVDSIKRSLPRHMPSSDFYLLLSRTIYLLRHGHMLLYPGDPDDGTINRNPLMQFRYLIINDALYIVANQKSICDIPAGTRIDQINSVDVPSLVRKYIYSVPTEGHGEQFRAAMLGYLFPFYTMYETGVGDTIVLQLNYLDSVFVCRIPTYKDFRSIVSEFSQSYKELISPNIQRDSLGITTSFATLRFPGGNHNIALMQVNSFINPGGKFYRESFMLLDSLNTRHLILDIRDNMGGFMLQASELFSYLTDSSFHFMDRPFVTSKFRIFYPPGQNIIQHLLSTLLIPVKLAAFSPIEPTEDGHYSHNAIEAKERQVSRYRFRGSVSLLVNGGTYSAATLLAANLKHAGNTLIVGEETGGASEGTAAMRLTTRRLPGSRFRLRHGLGFIQPYYKGGEPGYGIMPDVMIRPSLEDYIEGHDPQLQVILDLLTGHKEQEAPNPDNE